jgi:DNA-binding FadR family transcriptional regulator
MKEKKNKSTMDAAAARLRTIVLATKDGQMLGSEEDLIDRLKVSRATVRQVARLLEREGLLRVRRGINGGYFATRPDVHTIENVVSAYLEMFDTDVEDVFAIASVLWVEVMRKAAAKRDAKAKALVKRFREKVSALMPDASYEQVLALELESREAIFGLINSRYIQLIFHINMAFAQRSLSGMTSGREIAARQDFVHGWRNAKLMELQAIADGDQELGSIAARHIRSLWHKRMMERIGK